MNRESSEMFGSADQNSDLLSDLAWILKSKGKLQDNVWSIPLHLADMSLKDLGHVDTSIQEVVEKQCSRSGIEEDVISVSDEVVLEWSSIALALSGGGLRATFFELGILLYLSMADELRNIRAIVSVSGGSILSAHMAMRWEDAIKDNSGFQVVASELVRFARGDIRNSSMVRWLWSRLLVFSWFMPRFSRVSFLEEEYSKLFGEKTMGDIPITPKLPFFAFVATDTKLQHRVAMTNREIFRFKFNGNIIGDPILSSGTRMSTAVAASSCFPPVFNRMLLNYSHLGLRFGEFPEELNLMDGGVSGNLGIEVLIHLSGQRVIEARRILVCIAECGLAEEPGSGPLAALFAEGTALSEAGKTAAKQLGKRSRLLEFEKRTQNGFDLSFQAVTKLTGYRTDLDQPSWAELYALIIHGAAVCEASLGERVVASPSPNDISTAVRQIIQQSGGPSDLCEPEERELRQCGKRGFGVILCHIAAMLCAIIIFTSVTSEITSYIYPQYWGLRPLSAIYCLVVPERVIERDAQALATDVADSACSRNMSAIESEVVDGGLSKVKVAVGENSTTSRIYFRTSVHPESCEHAINCEFVFRGNFEADLVRQKGPIWIVGRITRVTANSQLFDVYIEFEECYGRSAEAERMD
ncbi:patatin-like phospholipase family protein [Bremerella cremea]|uniref:patatin-like phospholipase family protein n=1 Tax=Bremerella cremea TaxID=1031537 RepID=UPI0031E6CBD0